MPLGELPFSCLHSSYLRRLFVPSKEGRKGYRSRRCQHPFVMPVTPGANPHYWGKDQTVPFMGVNCRFRCEEERKQKKIRILAVRQVEATPQMPLKQRGFNFPSQRYYFMFFVLLFYAICVRYTKLSGSQRRHIFLVACVSLSKG